MARLPRYGGAKVGQASGGTPLQNIAAPAAAFGGGVADALGDLGTQVARAGEAITQHQVKMQEQDNAQEADNLITKYLLAEKDYLYTGDDAYYQKGGMNAYNGYKPAEEGVVRLRDDISNEASNPAVRKLVETATRRQMTFSLGNMASHAVSERKRGIVNTATAAQEVAISRAALKYNDEAGFKEELGFGVDQIFVKAELLGWTPAETDAAFLDLTNKAYAARINRMSLDSPQAARDMLRANIDRLEAGTAVQLEKNLEALIEPQEVEDAAALVKSGQAGVATSYSGNFGDLLRDVGERSPNINGRGQVSPAGAAGEMQVIPETAAYVARKLGIPFNPKDPKDLARLRDDKAFNKLIGDAYANEQLARYGGDPIKAAAAYNAGPGWVDAAIKRADEMRAAGTIGPQADWRWQLNNDRRSPKNRKETAAYMDRIAAHIGESADEVRSIEVAESLEGRLAQAAEVAEKTKPGDVKFARAVERRVKAEWAEEKSFEQAEERGAADRLYTIVAGGQNADGPKPKSVTEMLRMGGASANEDWQKLPQTTRNSIINQLEENARPEREAKKNTDPALLQAIKTFRAEAQLSPESFMARDFANMGQFSATQRQSLMQLQLKIAAGQGTLLDKNLDRAVSLGPVQDALREAGIEKDSDQYRVFSGRLLDGIETLSAIAAGRPLKDDELKAVAMSALQTRKEKTAPQLIPSVPNEEARTIIEAYRIQFPGKTPSTTEIARLYSAAQARKTRNGS